MPYEVIARKWRPQAFEEVTGQEVTTRSLRNALEHQRIHHAYLFSGVRGVGKTTTARLLAKSLNCHKSSQPTSTFCVPTDNDVCPSCLEIAESRSIDVQEIDAASNTGVDNIRESIIGTVSVLPARDRYRIFVVDEVHMLSNSAFNSLLKTLEEPPPRVVFIMATTEQHKVPDTILSRCQHYEFRAIEPVKIFDRLSLIAQAEQITIPKNALREIARAGQGSMRDAQSAFDQVISFAGQTITQGDVETALGIAGAEIIFRVVEGIRNRQPSEALAVVEVLVMRGYDLRAFCCDLLAHLRDLLVAKVTPTNELLASAVCDPEPLRLQAAPFSQSDLVRFFISLSDTELALRTSPNPRYQLEIGLVKLMEMSRLQPLGELLERMSTLETKGFAGRHPAEARPAEPQHSSTHEPAEGAIADVPTAPLDVNSAGPVDSDSSNGDASFADRLKLAIGRPLLVAALDAASLLQIDGSELHIEFLPQFRHLRDTIAKADNAKVIRQACSDLTGTPVGLRIAIKEKGVGPTLGPPTAADEKAALRAIAEKNPVVQQMLRTFRGEIVDVRRVTDID